MAGQVISLQCVCYIVGSLLSGVIRTNLYNVLYSVSKEGRISECVKDRLQEGNRTYVVWQKSNETGNALHEPTMLLPPPSHGS